MFFLRNFKTKADKATRLPRRESRERFHFRNRPDQQTKKRKGSPKNPTGWLPGIHPLKHEKLSNSTHTVPSMCVSLPQGSQSVLRNTKHIPRCTPTRLFSESRTKRYREVNILATIAKARNQMQETEA